MSTYSAKNVKSTRGREGAGFTATLCRDGRAVAEVQDWGDGGPVNFFWHDRQAVTMSARLSGALGPYEGKATLEEAAFHEHLLSAPPYRYAGADHVHTPDTYAELLVGAELNARRARRLAKTKVVFVRDRSMFAVRLDPTPVNFARVRRDHPGALVLNDLADAALLVAVRDLE